MEISFPLSKVCFCYQVEKPLDEFYRNKSCKDGSISRCKPCNKVRLDTPDLLRVSVRQVYSNCPKYIQQRVRKSDDMLASVARDMSRLSGDESRFILLVAMAAISRRET